MANLAIWYENRIKQLEGDRTIEVTCPICYAPPYSKCLKKKKDGFDFMDEFHTERIDFANDNSR